MASILKTQRRVRQEQAERGLCNYPGCLDRPEAGRTKCRPHLDYKAALMRKLREGYLETGRCQLCRKKPPVVGLKHCQRCLDAESDRGLSHYYERKSRGICTKCAKAPLTADSIYCKDCRDHRRVLQPSYDARRNRTKKARRA